MTKHDLLEASYTSLLEALADVSHGGWQQTRCPGWCRHDLVHHLLADAQRALVALHLPAAGPVDTDEVSYWRAWQPGTSDATDQLWQNRILASVWTYAPLVTRYVDTAHAVIAASRERPGNAVVTTQGTTMSVDALRSTLAVEATLHQLDLGVDRPSQVGLTEVRWVLDGLLGRPAPIEDDVRYALVGTGRERLSNDESTLLGSASDLLPLFG